MSCSSQPDSSNYTAVDSSANQLEELPSLSNAFTLKGENILFFFSAETSPE